MSVKAEDNITMKSDKPVYDIASNTDQYFWHTETGTDTGAHITEIPKEDFLEDPANGGGNLLARSNGIAVRDGLTELARFGADGMQVGKDGEQRVMITPDSFKVYDEDGSLPFVVTTEGSLKTRTDEHYTSVLASPYNSNTISVQLLGTVQDNRYYVDASTSGKPTGFTEYFENPTESWSAAKTIAGVEIRIRMLREGNVVIWFYNTTNSTRYVGAKFTQIYRESSAVINDAVYKTEHHRVTLIDSRGGSDPTLSYVYTNGKIAMLALTVYNPSSVSAGGIIYMGTLLDYIPQMPIRLITDVGSGIVAGQVAANGDITVMNTSHSTISRPKSNPLFLTGTYIYQ